MGRIKNFFGRVKDEKDFRFDFIIGIWSALIIIALIAGIIVAATLLLKKNDSDTAAEPAATPAATEEAVVATMDPSILEEEEKDEGGRFEEGLDEDIEFEDNGESSMLTAKTTVNVRTAPETTSSSLGKLAEGEKVEKIEELDNGWTKVKFNGKEAYIKSEYLVSADSGYLGSTYPPTQNNNTSAYATNTPARRTSKPAATAAAKKATKKPKVTKKPKKREVSDDDIYYSTEVPSPDREAVITHEPAAPTLPPAEPTNVPVEHSTSAPADPVETIATSAE